MGTGKLNKNTKDHLGTGGELSADKRWEEGVSVGAATSVETLSERKGQNFG